MRPARRSVAVRADFLGSPTNQVRRTERQAGGGPHTVRSPATPGCRFSGPAGPETDFLRLPPGGPVPALVLTLTLARPPSLPSPPTLTDHGAVHLPAPGGRPLRPGAHLHAPHQRRREAAARRPERGPHVQRPGRFQRRRRAGAGRVRPRHRRRHRPGPQGHRCVRSSAALVECRGGAALPWCPARRSSGALYAGDALRWAAGASRACSVQPLLQKPRMYRAASCSC